MKVHQQPAYVLHTRPYSETSLLIDAFTKEYGRLMLLAKGARRAKSRVRGILLPFHPLLIGWAGKGALPIVTSVEPNGRAARLGGEAFVSGFYLNELLLRLLHRHDAHEALFTHYEEAITQLGEATALHSILRIFEKKLLRDIGFGMALERDADSGEEIDAAARYYYVLEKGPVRAVDAVEDRAPPASSAYAPALPISGGAICALRDNQFSTARELQQAQKLTRALLDRQLNGRELHSRRVLLEMKSYAERME